MIFFALAIGYLGITVVITSLLTFVGSHKTPKEFFRNFEICIMWLPFVLAMVYLYGKAKLTGKRIL